MYQIYFNKKYLKENSSAVNKHQSSHIMPQLKTCLCLLNSFSIKSKSSTWLIRSYGTWFLAVSLISWPATLLYHPIPGTWAFCSCIFQISLSLAHLFPLPGMLFHRSFAHATVHSSLNTNGT